MLKGITISIFSQIGQLWVSLTPTLRKTLIYTPPFGYRILYCENHDCNPYLCLARALHSLEMAMAGNLHLQGTEHNCCWEREMVDTDLMEMVRVDRVSSLVDYRHCPGCWECRVLMVTLVKQTVMEYLQHKKNKTFKFIFLIITICQISVSNLRKIATQLWYKPCTPHQIEIRLKVKRINYFNPNYCFW